MTGTREAELAQTIDLLLDARRTGRALDGLPTALTPVNMEEVYAVQDRLAASVNDSGRPGGWKVGAPSPDATPMFCPMPLAWIAPNNSVLSGHRWRYRGLEAEIAFLVGEDLPPRAAPYSREEVLTAMRSCHPAIEVLETAFRDPTQVPREAMLADLQLHGGFVHGPAVSGWREIDFSRERVSLTVDGVVRVERTGSNTSGDLLKLLPWLANEGAARTGGLRAGQWITTGSWTGNTLAGKESVVAAEFAHAGRVDLRFL